MINTFIGLLIMVAVTILFAWLAWRSWKTTRARLKWPGVVLSGLLVIILGLVTAVAAKGTVQIYAPRGNPVPTITVEGTPQQIARGEHIAALICSACHTLEGTLPLSGGKDFVEEIGLPLGSFIPPNLTPAGGIGDWSDGELARAIREGTDPTGHLMPLMSTNAFYRLSEEDLVSVVAYLRSQPPVQHEGPQGSRPSFLAAIFAGAGLLPFKSVPPATFAVAPPKGPTAEHGAYIAGYLDCALCHGEDLSGGKGGLTPAGPSLRVVKEWTPDQFITTLRTGVSPHGHALDPDQMPWKFFGKLDDEDLTAVHAYVTSFP